MSSWIPSLFNPSVDDDDDDDPTSPAPKYTSSGDLSSMFRGVAAFLEQPPPQNSSFSSADAISGIKKDLEEIQGSFKSGLSLISSKLTSNFLQFRNPSNDDDDDEEEEDDVSQEGDVVGVNEEVVDFVRKISGRPQLWTDFPLSLPDDFAPSDHQREHAASIDQLVPELVTVRQNIQRQISDAKFWLIYFILLFPRLSEEDLMLLSTPEVIDARETLLKKLQNKSDSDHATSENPDSADNSGDRYSKGGDQNTSQNKNMPAEAVNTTSRRDIVNETKSGHHSEEVDTHSSVNAPKPSEGMDVSFSDLDDDDSESNKISPDKAHEWIRVKENSGAQGTKSQAGKSATRDKESEGEDSNEWLTVDDSDFDSLAEF